MRNKKPLPLTDLPSIENDNKGLLKPGQPSSTITIASPDCKILEEKFRHIIEGETDPEKLKNLSVSSADFNFEAGSLPGTPSFHRLQGFNLPDRDTAGSSSQSQVKPDPSDSATLDLSIKKATRPPQQSTKQTDIPTINIIKPEPEESSESFHCRSGGQTPTQIKCEPTWGDSEHSHPTNFFHGLSGLPPLPLQLPYPSYLPAGNNGLDEPDQSRLSAENMYRFMLPSQHQTVDEPAPVQAEVVPRPRKKEPENKQAFKCGKCGKCYNWNYNLNRHMRFECGINNRFECTLCRKRFPYKQNAAIHLKRKHKLPMDNADQMISGGHINLLSPDNHNAVTVNTPELLNDPSYNLAN
jgi:hypothetical protein